MKTKQLRNRIVIYFVSIVVLLSLLFSSVTLIFSFVVEDNFFYQILNGQKRLVKEQINQAQLPRPNVSFIKYYEDRSTLPLPIKIALEAEPRRKEFSDDSGKHFHIAFVDESNLHQHILLADVSDQLVVNKLMGTIFGFSSALLLFGIALALLLAFGTIKLVKKQLQPLDDLMDIVDNSPVTQLPTNFASRFKSNEIGRFAKVLQLALTRINSFINREQQFTRDVSHELRTPLTINQGALTLLAKTQLTPEQQKFVVRIDDANKQMQRTIEALLALAREKGTEIKKNNLKALIETCVLDNLEVLSGVDLCIEIESNVYIEMGEDEFKLILQNLLYNAVEHGKCNQIKLSFHDGSLSIIDNGKGFPSGLAISEAFETGVRGSSSNGCGIGLSLVKRLCEKYGVKVKIEQMENGVAVELCFQYQ
ncbi:HAMP domain-containing histidine kinase [Pseudoalteromonas sp. SG45-5]|uniref:sensor histidine kinase n=1 Tax=unclassified Pseudoalteromonas TaxID=194690 RepID=UPI0015FE4ECD|nr:MULTISPECIES: HAMP domain-containing sensor histidine kinase [unclassified Pseudoalteromonas]MBB1385299.1 HAMP domain-containing histidine kinase [Pseudoalteromonas sp. SG45-5]MBB1394933.1 HAMP domain-containing histidine kinase [Pseudoalteromonas sp. SG44-4]MBB1448265.1 HAMP domain-containing histidine kinase [Pseudoalteromonas sp. SG41-6]